MVVDRRLTETGKSSFPHVPAASKEHSIALREYCKTVFGRVWSNAMILEIGKGIWVKKWVRVAIRFYLEKIFKFMHEDP